MWLDWNKVARAVDLLNGPNYHLEGDQQFAYFSAHGRLSHTLGQGSAFIRPVVDLGVTQIYQGKLSEQGSGPVALKVASQINTFMTAEAALEMGGEFLMANNGVLRPFASLGIMAIVDGTDPEITGQFIGAPSSVDGFTVQGDIEDAVADLSFGFEAISRSGFYLRAMADIQLGEFTRNTSGSFKFSAPF